jgi:hypothetical protein
MPGMVEEKKALLNENDSNDVYDDDDMALNMTTKTYKQMPTTMSNLPAAMVVPIEEIRIPVCHLFNCLVG